VGDELAERHPLDLFPIVLEMVRQAPDDDGLAFVAAGPLEELLKFHGESILPMVEAVALTDARFRRALSGVWQSTIPPVVWVRVQAARAGEAGLDG